MAKQPATENTAANAPAKPKRPTPEQLQSLTRGGRYTFNPETGKFGELRKPTKSAAAEFGPKTGAK